MPADAVTAPQGWYLLFAMVDDVPSAGRIVHLTRSVPAEVEGFRLVGRAPTDLEWSPARSGGTPVSYELATGSLSDLRAAGNFGAGACLAGGIGGTRYSDTRSAPTAGDGYYYLVRARNECFAGTYGSSLRDQHGVATGGACP